MRVRANAPLLHEMTNTHCLRRKEVGDGVSQPVHVVGVLFLFVAWGM